MKGCVICGYCCTNGCIKVCSWCLECVFGVLGDLGGLVKREGGGGQWSTVR